MSNGNAKRTTGERQAQRLAHELRFGKGAYQDRINAGGRRIDAAISRAVKAAWKTAAKIEREFPASEARLCRFPKGWEPAVTLATPKAAPGKRGNKGAK